MPESPNNKALTPRECVDHVVRQIDKLVDKGACHTCAVLLVASDHDLDAERLYILYKEQHGDKD